MASRPVNQLASSNGDGTGTTNLVGDYSSAPLVASITAGVDKVVVVQRVIVSIEDAGSIDSGSYGNAIELTNGITISYYQAETLVASLTCDPITTNAQWAAHCHDVTIHDFGAGNSLLTARWTFAKGIPGGIALQPGDSIRIGLADDYTDLIGHRFLFQGHSPL